MPPPDLEARYEILGVHTRNMKIEDDVDLRRLAEDTELFTGAELEGLCREAGMVALRENISATVVCNRHFQTVKESLKPALTKEEIDSYASFMKTQVMAKSDQFESSEVKRQRNSFALPLSVGALSFILLAAGRYLFKHLDETRQQLAAT